jgi:hypothetical protein
MNKLLKLKNWLTVPDAARHLSILFGEEVTEADIFRFALDRHLTLSVDFVNKATAQCGKIIPPSEVKKVEVRSLDGDGFVDISDGISVGKEKVLIFDEGIVSIGGICDLAMIGAERLDVEQRYQELTDGPPVELFNLDGPIVNRSNGAWTRIIECFPDHMLRNKEKKYHPDNYHPANSLPSDAVFVVRTAALQDLEARLSEPAGSRPLGLRERTTLLTIIAALARLADIDFSKPSKAAMAIEGETARMGTRVSARAIEDHLKRIPEALDSRSDD